MIKAVLFDLDDTLLRLNLTAFIARYVSGAARLLGQAARTSPAALAVPFMRGFLAMDAQDRADSLTNEQVYVQTFLDACGIPLDDPAIADLIDFYEREVVPGFAGGIVSARPVAGAREAVDAVHATGLTCALATNPTFSLACDRARMGWAGVSEDDFALISTYSNSTRCKPSVRYYQEFANQLGVHLEECLMVGNDARRDIVRPDCGLRTAYVGHGRPRGAVWRGPMERFARELPQVVARLNEQDA
ncbi:HAD family hydrolase [Olsenella sp. An293]|uniref:HAD family hydrolase n=1 Tax=Olsenella sp. An293 TaxID=1965626 RepID=UPI000B37EACA|nr:HAD family hydrolase [Olsenella sp. An293]OUO33868.1 haloacid dehalogenase [Olsenella sp. An293]